MIDCCIEIVIETHFINYKKRPVIGMMLGFKKRTPRREIVIASSIGLLLVFGVTFISINGFGI